MLSQDNTTYPFKRTTLTNIQHSLNFVKPYFLQTNDIELNFVRLDNLSEKITNGLYYNHKNSMVPVLRQAQTSGILQDPVEFLK